MRTDTPEISLPRVSSFDRETQQLARVYAEALLRAALERGEVDSLREELDQFFSKVVPQDPLIAAFFNSGAVGRRRRADMLEKVFRPRVSELFCNLLMVLNDHERLMLIRPIAATYHALCDERAGRLVVEVRSAVELSEQQRQQLIERLRGEFQKEPVLDTTVDADLIGGFTVKVGDMLYDGSIRTRLQDIRKHLIARSNYEIQSGRDRFRTAD